MPCLFRAWMCLLRNRNFFVFNIYYKVEEQRLVSCTTGFTSSHVLCSSGKMVSSCFPTRGRHLLPPSQPQDWFLQIHRPAVTVVPQDPGLWSPSLLLLWASAVPVPRHLHLELKAGGCL